VEIDGIRTIRSPHPVADTVDLLTEAIAGAGAKVFAVVDHSGEAAAAGLALRDTKLIVFGSPVVGTPVMQVAPLAALDLPLKILVWADDGGGVWMGHLDAGWLATRYGLTPDQAAPLGAAAKLVDRIAG
jgi:uncharacterized protein (DUF302 family)